MLIMARYIWTAGHNSLYTPQLGRDRNNLKLSNTANLYITTFS